MTTTYPSAKSLVLALPLLSVIAGCCCQAVPLPDERHCPTDARRLYWACGEEAVRHCPCGPDREFYGLKPTEWRSWPEGWRCNDGRWEVPVSQPESAYVESAGASQPSDESAVVSEAELDRKLNNPFSHIAVPQPPIAGNPTIGNVAEPPATNLPVATTAPEDAAPTIPAFEPTPIVNSLDVFKPPTEIKGPVTSETQPPPAANELEAAPARNVPHVESTLPDRVQQHLLETLTL